MNKITIKWAPFKLENIFSEVYIAKSSDSNALETGNVPFIGRSNSLNGLQGEYHIPQEKVVQGNAISIAMVGNPIAFYQEYDFGTSQNILILKSKYLNKYNALFLVDILNEYLSSKNYGYGYPLGLKRAKRDKIMLPANSKNQPDWEFMDKEGKKLYNNQINNLKSYLVNKYNSIKKIKEPKKSEDKEWQSFEVEKISTVLSGKDIYKRERTKGTTPYITSGSSTNGIGYFVGNDNKTKSKDVISVNRNGAVGYSFYHPYEALFGNDTRRVIPNYDNKYSSLFLSHMITMQKEKYGYGLKMGTARLKKQKIMLPVNENNKPDWEYMKNYMMYIEYKQLTKLIEHLN